MLLASPPPVCAHGGGSGGVGSGRGVAVAGGGWWWWCRSQVTYEVRERACVLCVPGCASLRRVCSYPCGVRGVRGMQGTAHGKLMRTACHACWRVRSHAGWRVRSAPASMASSAHLEARARR